VFNATGFLTRWSNVQSRHDLACGYYLEQTSGQIRSTGVDLDSQFQVTRSLRLGVSASFTDALTSEAIPNLDAGKAAQVPYSPREILRVSVGYRRQLPIGILSLQADYDYRSAEGTEFDAGSALFRKILDTRVANVTGTWTVGTTTMTLYVRNLTNTQIVTGINPNGYPPFQPGDTVYLGRPRSVGFQLQISL
jgi:outer membrane receptor protein involved in Fe transport